MEDRTLRILEYSRITEKLAGFAGSPMGREMCRKLTPSTDLTRIRQMQTETTDALKRVYKNGSVSFSGIRDVRPSLLRLKVGASIGIPELLGIASTLETALRVKAYGRREETDEERDCLDPLFKILEPLSPLTRDIRRCFPDEETVADEASPALRSVRRQIRLTNDRIHSQLSQMVSSSSMSSMLQDNIVTMRSGRYCIPVKAEYRAQVPGMIHDQSSTGATLFIEPMAVVKLNNDLSQLAAKEKQEIDKIIDSLSQEAAESLEFIEQDVSVLTQLDFIFARALLSKSYNGTEPIFNQTGYINIRQARHPLLDRRTVVPIDVYIGHRPRKLTEMVSKTKDASAPEQPQEFSMLIITGPNTGGKTVSLKTVGLLTLMGQSGLNIPAAEHSELAVFSNVYTDIGDEQSIEQSLSTFSAHMTNIIDILKNADEHSLVLLDELCAGTDPTEGASLAISILKNLLDRGITTMATTHYSELKVFALDTPNVSNASCEFDVETLSPTYRLLIGLPGKSNAFAISQKLGLPQEIIDDASKNIDAQEKNFEDLLTDLEQSRRTIEKEQAEITHYRDEMEKLKSRLETKRENIDKQKQKILDDARQKAQNILQDAKDYADHTIRTMNKLSQGGGRMKEMEHERTKIREKIDRTQSKTNPAPRRTKNYAPEDFHQGDSVLVTSMNVRGTVISRPNSKGEIMVQMGILQSRIPYTDLIPVEDKEEKKLNESLNKRMKEQNDSFTEQHQSHKKHGQKDFAAGRRNNGQSSYSSISTDKSMSAETSVNLIGKTVDEAMSELDKFLDDAYLAHIPAVTIIHGRGTGALRKAVHEKLRRTKYVKSYRLGRYGEGEAGVTIAELE